MWEKQRVEDIGGILRQIEEHLIRVSREGQAQVRRPEEVSRELTFLARDLHQLFQRILQRLDQRDHTFDQEVRLKELCPRCLWLYRRAREEEFFLHQLQLERELRRLVSPDAFSIYQTLQAIQTEEEGFRGLDDEALTRVLSETTSVAGEAQEEDSLTPGMSRP